MLTPTTTVGSAGAPLVPCSLVDVEFSEISNPAPEKVLTVDQDVDGAFTGFGGFK